MTDQLTEDRIQEFKEAFEYFDKDKDGLLTIKELADLMTRIGNPPTDQELKDMINEVDIEKNGNIDFKEFLGLIARKLRDSDGEEELIETFNLIDRDGNKLISGAEIRHILECMGEKISDDELEQMIEEADLDADGFVNYDEFVKIINKNTS